MPMQATSMGWAPISTPSLRHSSAGFSASPLTKYTAFRGATLSTKRSFRYRRKLAGMIGPEPDVLVQVEHDDLEPVDALAGHEMFEHLELAGPRREDDVRLSLVSNCAADRLGGAVGRGGPRLSLGLDRRTCSSENP